MPSAPTNHHDVAPAWKALGAASGFNPRSLHDCNILLLGGKMQGKTSLMAAMPENLILDLDLGADLIPGIQATVLPIRSHAELEKAICLLEKERAAGVCPFRHVTFDTGEALQTMKRVELTREVNTKPCSYNLSGRRYEDITDFKSSDKGSGGWDMVNRGTWAFLKRVNNAGLAWTCLSHIKEYAKVVRGEQAISMRTAMTAGCEAPIVRAAHIVMGIEQCGRKEMLFEETTDTSGKTTKHYKGDRYEMNFQLNLQTRDGEPTDLSRGTRVDLPSVITLPDVKERPLTELWAALQDAYDKGMARMEERHKCSLTSPIPITKESVQ